MPIYEYQCKKCNHQFEQLQKVTDKPLAICPQCGKNALIKIISQTSFQLKGTGWYVTDFKDKKKETENKKTEVKPEKAEVKSKTTEKTGDKK